MAEVYSKQVIVCTKEQRGSGITLSPYRRITEVFDMDGKKIADMDTMPITLETAIDFLKEHNLLTNEVSEAFHKKFID